MSLQIHPKKSTYRRVGYNCGMNTTQVFHPETISRQGERNAWILSGFAVVVSLLLMWRYAAPPAWIVILTVFMLLSAMLISLSNWVDRRTVLTINADGIAYRNGLRQVTLTWDQIEKIKVAPDRWGQRVHVMGSRAAFNFRLLSEVEFQGKVRGQMGFAAGAQILEKIIEASGLRQMEDEESGHYYARP